MALRPPRNGCDPFETSSGIVIRDLYTPADTAGLDEDRDLGRPGGVPLHARRPAHDVPRPLLDDAPVRGFATAEETNQRFRYLLAQGQTGLSVAFDLPTQMGYDSDAPEAEGEVGRVGVRSPAWPTCRSCSMACRSAEVSTSMTINATAPILLALYVAAAESQGVPRAAIGGTTQNDILKEYIARGTYIFPPRPSMRLVTDVFEFCATELPKWNTISISGYHMREAGATAAQELAFTLADAIAYVDAAVARGLDVDAFAGRLSFFFAAWSELFEEVAKFRVARRMWATIMKERFGAKDPRSWVCRFHVQTAGSSLTAQSVDNNVVGRRSRPGRGARGGPEPPYQLTRRGARAADRGGGPSRAAHQQILAHEAGVTETPDPLAGSYYVESLTNELEAARGPTSTRSRRWAGRSPPSRAASSSARSRRRPTASSARSSRATRSSSGSTDSGTTRSRPRRSIASIRRARVARSSASVESEPSAPPRAGSTPWTGSRRRLVERAT
jgi:methylmalonyl-CoA mutase N-terminal domain/subunit